MPNILSEILKRRKNEKEFKNKRWNYRAKLLANEVNENIAIGERKKYGIPENLYQKNKEKIRNKLGYNY